MPKRVACTLVFGKGLVAGFLLTVWGLGLVSDGEAHRHRSLAVPLGGLIAFLSLTGLAQLLTRGSMRRTALLLAITAAAAWLTLSL